MANVHRAYNITDDAYYVRVQGSKDLDKYTGPGAERASYQKLRQLIAIEQQKDKTSKMIDHAQPT